MLLMGGIWRVIFYGDFMMGVYFYLLMDIIIIMVHLYPRSISHACILLPLFFFWLGFPGSKYVLMGVCLCSFFLCSSVIWRGI